MHQLQRLVLAEAVEGQAQPCVDAPVWPTPRIEIGTVTAVVVLQTLKFAGYPSIVRPRSEAILLAMGETIRGKRRPVDPTNLRSWSQL